MEDNHIIELYFQRSEQAIAATAAKFGTFCYSIAYNILRDPMDSEETVSDTYLDVWNAIPPHRPVKFSAFLGKLTRRNALDRLDYRCAEKRGGGQVSLALEELAECLPSGSDPQTELELAELGRILNDFVRALPGTERRVFVCRYWYLASVREIADKFGFSQSKVKSILFRVRKKLRVHLEKEGIAV